jgi:hypothetical protein
MLVLFIFAPTSRTIGYGIDRSGRSSFCVQAKDIRPANLQPRECHLTYLRLTGPICLYTMVENQFRVCFCSNFFPPKSTVRFGFRANRGQHSRSNNATRIAQTRTVISPKVRADLSPVPRSRLIRTSKSRLISPAEEAGFVSGLGPGLQTYWRDDICQSVRLVTS